jgi:hypothetical protein
MSILTFLHNAFASTKGPYDRYVGHHTRRFCSRAARRARNSEQKRIWFSSAISADEVIAALAGMEKRRPLGALAEWHLRPGVDGKSYLKALRVYLSGLLILYGTCKDELLARIGMKEHEFMENWQSVFEYEKEDRAVFDDTLLPAFRDGGIEGLAGAVGTLIRGALFLPDDPFGTAARTSLYDLMLSDLMAVKRHLEKQKENSAEGREPQIGKPCSK